MSWQLEKDFWPLMKIRVLELVDYKSTVTVEFGRIDLDFWEDFSKKAFGRRFLALLEEDFEEKQTGGFFLEGGFGIFLFEEIVWSERKIGKEFLVILVFIGRRERFLLSFFWERFKENRF